MPQTKIPDEILVLAFESVRGKITDKMRAVGFGRMDDGYVIRFFLSDTPTELENSLADEAKEFFKQRIGELSDGSVRSELIVADTPVGKLPWPEKVLFVASDAFQETYGVNK